MVLEDEQIEETEETSETEDDTSVEGLDTYQTAASSLRPEDDGDDVEEAEEVPVHTKKKPKEIFCEDDIKALALDYFDDPTIEKYHEITIRCIPLMDYVVSEFDLRNLQVEPGDLRNEIVVKFTQILNDFKSKRGRMFSYLLICFKNYLTSYVSKLGTRRHYALPEGIEETEEMPLNGFNEDYMMEEAFKQLQDIPVRNIDPDSIMVFKYYTSVLKEGGISDKARCTNTAKIVSNLSASCCEFLYDCFMHSVKNSMMESYFTKLHTTDLFKIRHLESLLPEMLESLGEDTTLKVMALFGGSVIKLPTLEHYHKLEKELEIFKRVNADSTDRNIEKVGRTYGFPKTRVRKIHASMMKTLKLVPDRKINIKVSEV